MATETITSTQRLVMVGTSFEGKGGIASVLKVYKKAGLFDAWPITFISTFKGGSPIRKLLTAIGGWFRFLWQLSSPCVVHVNVSSRASFWRKSCFIWPAIWLENPVIFHLHGSEFMQWFRNECGPKQRGKITRLLDRCSEVIVLSESWKRDIASITSAPVTVIENPGISVPPSSGGDGKTLLFLGRVGHRKGTYDLLRALATVSADWRLVCAGDGDVETARELAHELGIGDRVEFPGWIGGAEKAELLSQAAAYVLPSSAEGLPMSLLEAMSAGLPIVSTPVGGIPEAVTHGKEGLLVPVGGEAQLAEAITQLLEDADLRTRMGEAARETFLSRFDTNVVIPKLETVYRQFGVEREGVPVTQ